MKHPFSRILLLAPIVLIAAASEGRAGPSLTSTEVRLVESGGGRTGLVLDHTGGDEEPGAQPDGGYFDEQAAFREAFADLLGRSAPLDDVLPAPPQEDGRARFEPIGCDIVPVCSGDFCPFITCAHCH